MRIVRYLCVAMLLLGQPAFAEPGAPGYTKTHGGAWFLEIRPGAGKPAAVGDVATVHLRGWLDDGGQKGREILDSRKENQPIAFVIGTDRVMPGWNEGVTGMRKGGRRLVRVPPALGFGDRGSEDVIPPGATLLFQIDLVDLRRAGQ